MEAKFDLSRLKNYLIGLHMMFCLVSAPNLSFSQSDKTNRVKWQIESDSILTIPNEDKLLRPSIYHFVKGLKKVFTTEQNLIYLGTGTFSSLLVWPHDEDISDDIKEENLKRFDFLHPIKVGGIITTVGTPVVTYFIGRIANNTYLANTGLYITEALIASQFVTVATKHLVQRTRPNEENNLSFPSGHTSGMFTIAAVLGVRHGYKAGVPSYILASLVGMSRIVQYKHFPTDVITGAALGIIFGQSFAKSGKTRPSVSVAPIINSDYAGIGFQRRF